MRSSLCRRSACARSRTAAAPSQWRRDSWAAFSSSAAAITTPAAAAEPPAGAGWSDAMASTRWLSRPFSEGRSVVADLRLAPGDELAQLLVDSRVDARVGVFLEDLLPARCSHHVGRLRTHAVPPVEVLGRGDPRPVETCPVVAQRVLSAQEVASGSDLSPCAHGHRLVVDRKATFENPFEHPWC